MPTSLALIFSGGAGRRVHLPADTPARIIGMLATGILLGPYVLDFL